MFFSDVVIAIAITLLVLDIRVPRAEELPAGETLVTALLAFVSAFVSIAIFVGLTILFFLPSSAHRKM